MLTVTLAISLGAIVVGKFWLLRAAFNAGVPPTVIDWLTQKPDFRNGPTMPVALISRAKVYTPPVAGARMLKPKLLVPEGATVDPSAAEVCPQRFVGESSLMRLK